MHRSEHHSVLAGQDHPRKTRRKVGDIVIPVVGGITPIAILIVNIAEFIAHHLAEFRWTISVLAFVSGVMLNSWAALAIYRVLKNRVPDNPLVADRNQELMFMVVMFIVILVAAVTAVLCYIGLQNPKDLPNGISVVTASLALLIPVLLQDLIRRFVPKKT